MSEYLLLDLHLMPTYFFPITKVSLDITFVPVMQTYKHALPRVLRASSSSAEASHTLYAIWAVLMGSGRDIWPVARLRNPSHPAPFFHSYELDMPFYTPDNQFHE